MPIAIIIITPLAVALLSSALHKTNDKNE